MMKINGIKIPLKTMFQVQKEKKALHRNDNKEIVTTANKNGDVVILSYNDSSHTDLHYARLIRNDGSETVKFYNTSEKKYRQPYVRSIETWDKYKDNLIFNKQTDIQYNGSSRIPEIISTMYSDKDGCDGVKIERKFPYSEYIKQFQRPQE